MKQPAAPLTYNPTTFSQGRMDFAWEELTDDDRVRAYADWEAGKGLIGGDPRHRPGSQLLPAWGIDRPFFRALALDDARGSNGATPAQPAWHRISRWRSRSAMGAATSCSTGRSVSRNTSFIGYETKIKATRLI
jgi:tRNA (guanine-N7-)-methyltransferase